MSFVVSVALLAVITGITCALPGTFLVLRHQSMLIDAMSHAVLPGIVIGALLSGTTSSPIMIVIASALGMLVVIGAEKLRNTGLIAGDANQGLIFPVLFAIGIILLSTILSNVHICEDTVLTGDINLMALEAEHLIHNNLDFGPRTMWVLLFVFALNALYIGVTYRVLKLATFDPMLARTMGFPVRLVEYGLMLLVSMTVVVAFNTAGAILVVALMVVPPATALLVSKTLPQMIGLSLLIAALTSLTGFWVAFEFDLATSAMMAVVDGVVFLAVFMGTKCLARFKGRQALLALQA
ncbi:ABC 3 transport family protein [Gleimia coleocanis DSM 15436]|uniref:ABC 3 transport family protein n=1 Tax=Gleimia coleocanis DSM 15436 TaxID=525245 RepID=C0VY75_9ACTO|nr:metal ABC transporter permease [Gleimia coleocanis]EEH64378.1 ABC 3 transport family protein [Gleimia coleocanis DSM 15436]